MPITLSVLEGPHAGRVFKFDSHDTFLIGRAPEAHFDLPDDPYFSRMHLLIEVNPPLCRLTDLGSRNGTLVNDLKVRQAELKNGDRVRGGTTLLHLAITAGDNVEATLDLPDAPTPQVAQPTKPINTTAEPEPAAPAVESTGSYRPNLASMFPNIPGYTVQKELGSGAMGVVYQAIHERDGSMVALKTIKPTVAPTETIVKRFLREANILKSLDHPNIVAYRDMGEAGGLMYFAMEFVDARDTESMIKKSGPMEIDRAVKIVASALKALAYAHERGIVHRDIKPANLLLAKKDGKLVVKVADFGLARIYQSSQMSGLTMAETTGGTPLFMPPEQITDFRKAKPPADQYSAAATLYYLLTGRGPHTAKKVEELFRKILLEEPTPLRELCQGASKKLEQAIHRALMRQPEARFADVLQFRQAILDGC